MANKHDTTAMTSGSFHVLAEKLEYFASRYRDVATRMEASDIEEVQVTGLKTFDRAVEYMRGAIASATTALDKAMIERPLPDIITDTSKENADRVAAAAFDAAGEPKTEQQPKKKRKRSR